MSARTSLRMARNAGAALLLVAALGCGAPKRYVNPNADLSAIKSVAVLPFENLTGDRLASERIQRVFLTELLIFDAFDVVEPGQVVQALRTLNADPAALAQEDFKRVGKAVKADALFVGAIVECQDRAGSADGSIVTLQLRLVEAESGATLWSVTRSGRGATVGSRLFGTSAKSAPVLAAELIRDELPHLFR